VVEPLPDDPLPVALCVYPGGQSVALVVLLLVLPEPLALLDVEPSLPPAPALPAVSPEPVGTQPAGMLPSDRLPLPVEPEFMLEPDELEPVPVVVPGEPEPVPEVPELPPVCASAVPAASIAANVKATTFVIFALHTV